MAEDHKKENISKISRREFLKDAGLVVGGATVGSMAILSACSNETKTVSETITNTTTKTVTSIPETITVTAQPEPTSTNDTKINMTINGSAYEVGIKTHWVLHYVLHDVLGFTSVKDMCTGEGACGSCSVIVNGHAVLSCMTLASECDGATIETAEGLALANHPLIDTYVENDCMQCGYCTPGFIVTAKALLDMKKNPSEADVRNALGGNICRCGTYPQHIIAVLAAAEKLA